MIKMNNLKTINKLLLIAIVGILLVGTITALSLSLSIIDYTKIKSVTTIDSHAICEKEAVNSISLSDVETKCPKIVKDIKLSKDSLIQIDLIENPKGELIYKVWSKK